MVANHAQGYLPVIYQCFNVIINYCLRSQDLEVRLARVDKSGQFKAWIYQHRILSRILWPFLVYEDPILTVECFEMRVSWFLQRWLGLPRSLSSDWQTNILKLPNEEFMVSCMRDVLQYQESSKHKVS